MWESKSDHSLIDWYHPHFTIDGLHPQRSDLAARESNSQRDMLIYQDFIAGQVTELLTQYGRIDYMWFDFPYSHRDWGWSKGKGAEDWDLVGELPPLNNFNQKNHWKKTVYLFFGKPVRQCTGLGAMIAMRWNGNQVICW